MRHAGVSGMTP